MATPDTEIVMKKIMTYNDANDFGMVSAGDVAKLADLTAELLAASYHKARYLTVCLDNLVFFRPVKVRDEVIVKASINCVKNSSMEIGLRIEVSDQGKKKPEHVTSMYATLVSVDEGLKPKSIPQVKPKNPLQKRRYDEGLERMARRSELKKVLSAKAK